MFHTLRRIAVIDDDCISLFLINKLLLQKQITDATIPFSNGIDALNYFSSNSESLLKLPDLILLDIKMPEMSGWQFLRELNQIEFTAGYKPQICILSAETTIDFDIFKNSHCVKGYLLKPIILSKLVTVIESLTTKIQDRDLANISLAAYE